MPPIAEPRKEPAATDEEIAREAASQIRLRVERDIDEEHVGNIILAALRRRPEASRIAELKRENAQLKVWAGKCEKSQSAWQDNHAKELERSDALQQRLAKAEADTRRLDWLAKNQTINQGLWVGGYFFKSGLRWQEDRIREAIDAASSPAQEAKEIGQDVHCTVCGLRKKPVGRSAPDVVVNSLCDDDCSGYRQEPHPGQLWPGESREEFGY